MPQELDLVTGDGVVEQGFTGIARSARLLLLDLTGVSFCDARADHRHATRRTAERG